jgi:hypothetical protein
LSVPVALDALAEEISRRGPTAYLLTVSDDGRPHVVAVSVAFQGETLVVVAGGRTTHNAAVRPLVSLLWSDPEFSLIVDGRATVVEGNVVVSPTAAVKHRGGSAPACKPVT